MIKRFMVRFPLIRELVLYGIIGGIAAGLDGLIFVLLRSIRLNLYIANFIGNSVGILVSFLLNTYFNFKLKDKFAERMLKFFAVGYCGLLLSTAMLHIGVNILNIREIMVKLASIVAVAIFQFILNKFITYKRGTRS